MGQVLWGVKGNGAGGCGDPEEVLQPLFLCFCSWFVCQCVGVCDRGVARNTGLLFLGQHGARTPPRMFSWSVALNPVALDSVAAAVGVREGSGFSVLHCICTDQCRTLRRSQPTTRRPGLPYSSGGVFFHRFSCSVLVCGSERAGVCVCYTSVCVSGGMEACPTYVHCRPVRPVPSQVCVCVCACVWVDVSFWVSIFVSKGASHPRLLTSPSRSVSVWPDERCRYPVHAPAGTLGFRGRVCPGPCNVCLCVRGGGGGYESGG